MGFPPVESRSITPQGGESVALPFGRPWGSNPVVDITCFTGEIVGQLSSFCSTISGTHKRPDLPLAPSTNVTGKPGRTPRCRSSAPAEREPLPLEHSSDIEGPKPSLPRIQRKIGLGSAASCPWKATNRSGEIRSRRIGKILKAEESTYCPSRPSPRL